MTGILLSSLLASAGPLPDAEEFIATYGAEPPNVLFVVDLSGDLQDSCGEDRCIDTITDTLYELSLRTDWAYLGVVGTSLAGTRSYTPLSGLGADRDHFRAALDTISAAPSGGDNNLAETLSLLAKGYLALPADGVYSSGDFGAGPICASCQDTHIVVLTAGLPTGDDNPVSPIPADLSMEWNVRCDASGVRGSFQTDSRCLYDNIAWLLYNRDHASLTGEQTATVHTIHVSDTVTDAAFYLYASGSYQSDYNGALAFVDDSDGVRTALGDVMEWIRWPLVGDSAPLLHAAGDQLLYSYYTAASGNPLHEGHLLGYSLGTDGDDPSTLGQVVYDGKEELDKAHWDAGVELWERAIQARDYNEEDRDGSGTRDLYTFLPELGALPGTSSQLADGRFAFDRSLVELVAANPSVAPLLLPVGETGADHGWDLDRDASVDLDDLQVLVDFTRGVESIPYRHLSRYRGRWRLGDAPRSGLAVVSGRNNNYSSDPTYRNFLRQVSQQTTEVALFASNAGMVHAIALHDGDELWGWVPGRLLLQQRDTPEEGRLIDVIRFGRQRLMDGSVSVEDVWLDINNDGEKQCSGDLSSCEWRRIAVVSQGRGGPAVLALDVTDPTTPRFLWEQVDVDHPGATGYGSQSVVVAPLQDGDTLRWTALWGSGHPRTASTGAVSQHSEPTLYLRGIDDTYDASPRSSYDAQAQTGRFPTGGLVWPDAPGADLDADGRAEQAAVPGAPAAVDLDNDGDIDAMYLHVTDVRDPDAPSSTLFKLLFGDDPDSPTWCELFDSADAAGGPTAAAFAPTTAWMADGSLAVFWGSGGPFTGRSGDTGHLFGIRDADPWGCAVPEPLCGSQGALPLAAGARITDTPTIHNGTVYFSSWVSSTDGCGGGSGRIYGLRYDTCTGNLTDPETGETEQSFVSVASYPSTITFSDSGRLLYAMPGTEGPIASLPTGDPMQGTELISHMLLGN